MDILWSDDEVTLFTYKLSTLKTILLVKFECIELLSKVAFHNISWELIPSKSVSESANSLLQR
jgi:hypothetical protein